MKKKIIILLILLVGLFLRVVNIQTNPPALYGDELTITLDAYSLLKTGNDQLGNFMPLTFPMGAGRPAGYVYGSIPFIAVFGPTALGVRSLSILSGIGIIILLYLIGRRLFSEKLGLLSAGLGIISPWEIALSRGGFEAHFALFLALLGAYLFFLAKQKPILYIFSALSFGLTLHTYPTYKVSLLLFLPLIFWFVGDLKGTIKRKYCLLAVVIFISLAVLVLSQTFIAGSEKRFSNINIFSQQRDSTEQKINFERQISELPKNIKKYFHNKPIEYTKIFIENYLQNFSLDFLVLHGDRNPRHNMATMGEIYFAEVILIVAALLKFWQKQKRITIFLILWILLAPIPAAIVDLPHALRSSFMLPPLIMISALGLVTIVNYHNKLVLFLISAFFVIQFTFFVQKLFFLAPGEYSNFWSYSAKLASEIAIANKDKYDKIILSDHIDNMEFAYPAYAEVHPDQIIHQNSNASWLNTYKFKQYDNVFIGSIPDNEINSLLASLEGSILYMGSFSSKNYLEDYEIINGKSEQDDLVLKKVFK